MASYPLAHLKYTLSRALSGRQVTRAHLSDGLGIVADTLPKRAKVLGEVANAVRLFLYVHALQPCCITLQ